jgi:type 1 glutamine amidotransferase
MIKSIRWMIPAALCGSFFVAAPAAKSEIPAAEAAKIAAAIPAAPLAKPKKARKVLVFSVTNGFKHGSIPTGHEAFRQLGEKTGAFEAVISDELANFESASIKQFDAICFLSTTGDPFMPNGDTLKGMNDDQRKEAQARGLALRESMMGFIKGGGGFVGIHSATDTFYEWADYGTMICGYFNGHPWGAGTEVSIKVEPGKEKHPLAVMFGGENLEFKEEIYQFKEPYDSSKVEMLLRLDTEKTDMNGKGNREDKDYGVSWARNWGKGRVFYSSLGHNEHIFQNPKVLLHFLAGLQWSIGDLEAPVSK